MKESTKVFLTVGAILTGVPSLFGLMVWQLHNERLRDTQENLDGIVLAESESFFTHPLSPFAIANTAHPLNHPPEEQNKNHNYLIWNSDNRLVLVYTQDNSDPWNVLEQVKTVCYRQGKETQIDILPYVFREGQKEEVGAANMFVDVPVYQLKDIVQE